MRISSFFRRLRRPARRPATDELADWPRLDTPEGRRVFWEDYRRYYEELRADPEAWREEMRERAAFDLAAVPRADLAELD